MSLTSISKYVSLGAIRSIALKPWTLLKVPMYWNELRTYRKLEKEQVGQHSSLRIYPCLNDKLDNQSTGYYFYQDCWAARQVFREKPSSFVDVGSTVLLVGILSQFVPGISVDIRPIQSQLSGLTSKAGSILQLPFQDNEVPCLTTMCVIEHIGLGRYGDPLNPYGSMEAAAEIARVIAPGGIVVYSVPVGRAMTEFNANRRFHYKNAIALFAGWHLVDSCILTPQPKPFSSEEDLLKLRDPVACFCMRKPNK